jgi:hypothetical protein
MSARTRAIARDRRIAEAEAIARAERQARKIQADMIHALRMENARLKETRSYAMSQAGLRRAVVKTDAARIERRDIASIDTHNANVNAARRGNVTEASQDAYGDAW